MKRRLAFLLFLALAMGSWGCSSEPPGLSSSGKERAQDPTPSGKSLPSETEERSSPGKNEPAPPMQPPPKVDPQDLKELVRGNNEFALDLYSRLAQTTEGNIVFSPFSISTALAMTYAGARGRTAEEMAKVLHFTLPPERLHPAFANLLWELGGDGKPRPFQLHTANALWGQQGYPFLSSFLHLGKDLYWASLQELDFLRQPQQTRRIINQWVANNTKEKIKEIIGPNSLDPGTLLILTNAIYFKAGWLKPFPKSGTKMAIFEIGPENKIVVPMMYIQKHFNYWCSEDSQWLELPYQMGELSMYLVLPNKGELKVYEKTLTAAVIDKGIKNLKLHVGIVGLPRFKLNTGYNLREALIFLGMSTAFSGKADFTKMVAKGGLTIGFITHQAYLNVDELGSEAAASTAVGMISSRSPPFSFIAERPFLFFIRDNQTGSILFLGRVVRPGKLS